jgi:hypothetical protein
VAFLLGSHVARTTILTVILDKFVSGVFPIFLNSLDSDLEMGGGMMFPSTLEVGDEILIFGFAEFSTTHENNTETDA